MTESTDPVAADRALRNRFEDEAVRQGLTMVDFGYHASRDGVKPDQASAVLTADPEALQASIEQLATQRAFDDVVAGDAAATADAAVDDLRSRIARGGSILDL